MNGYSVVSGGAAIMLGLILAGAAVGKLRAPHEAARVVALYVPVSTRLARLLGAPLALLELATGIALLLPALRAHAAIVATLLLLLYVLAVALALARGGAGEDCGCGGIAGKVPIGTGLLLRNIGLAAIAAALAAAPRAGSEWLASIGLAALGLLLFQALNFLLARETLLADD